MGSLNLKLEERDFLSEKQRIWNQLNENRLLRQKKEECRKGRFLHEKCYTFKNESYYKILRMMGEYYIKVSDYEKITLKQSIVTLYSYTFHGLKTMKCYAKFTKYSDKLFISEVSTRDYFKMYDLEKE
jgi:hypothetical protein